MSEEDSTALVPTGSESFAYKGLDPSDAEFVREAAKRIRAHGRRMVQEVIAIGEELLAVKERLLHGRFGAWLNEEFSMTQATAENYMNSARLVRQNPKYLDFGGNLTALYKLAADSTPEEVRGAVLDGTVEPTPVAIQRAITEQVNHGGFGGPVKALHSDLMAAAGRHPLETYQQIAEQGGPPPLEQIQAAFDVFLKVWHLRATRTTLAAMLLDVMDLRDAAEIAPKPDAHVLARGLVEQPRRRVVAAQWVKSLQAAIAEAKEAAPRAHTDG